MSGLFWPPQCCASVPGAITIVGTFTLESDQCRKSPYSPQENTATKGVAILRTCYRWVFSRYPKTPNGISLHAHGLKAHLDTSQAAGEASQNIVCIADRPFLPTGCKGPLAMLLHLKTSWQPLGTLLRVQATGLGF